MQQAVVTQSCSLIPALDLCAHESGTSATHQGTDFVTVVLFPACRIVCPSLLCKGNRTAAEATISVGHRAHSWVRHLREAGWGSVQIWSGCACGKRRLHTAVPSLWTGSCPVQRCPLRLSTDSSSLPFILPWIFFFFLSQSQKLFRNYCVIPWRSE